jgi:hypothetical protein
LNTNLWYVFLVRRLEGIASNSLSILSVNV